MKGWKMSIESLLKIQNLKTSPSDIIKKLEEATEQELYRSALKVQTDLNLGEILRYLFNNQQWSSAKNVLDLGCGTGDHISHIARYFPDKFYTGVDIDEHFINIAKEQTKALKNCTFYCADLYDFSQGQYDFVILRAVLQHLKDTDRFMKHLPNLLQDHAVVLFSDTTSDNFINSYPPIPTFDDFYNQLEVLQKEHDGNRNCLIELEENLEKYNFKLIEAYNREIPITTEEHKVKIIQYIILGCSVAKKMIPVRIELKNLFDDIIKWHDSNAPYIQIKTRWMMIQKG